MVLHPAPSTDNASCTTTPWQKKEKLHPPPLPPPGNISQYFLEFDTFFDFEFKNTSNLIFLGFKVTFESFSLLVYRASK